MQEMAELCSNRSGARSDFDHIGVIYHQAIKKIGTATTLGVELLRCLFSSTL